MSTTVTTIGRSFVSAIGALILTAGGIAFAAAPARAAPPHAPIVSAAPATGLVGAIRY